MFDDDVWRYSPVGPFTTLGLAAVGLGLLVYVARVPSSRSRLVARGLLAASVLVIAALTARGSLANTGGAFSWRLGDSIARELGNVNRELGLVNVVGNVLMFLPVGWLVAVLVARHPLLLGLSAAAGLSAVVEVGQVLSGSVGDIDDVVLNSAGGLCGAVAAMAVAHLGSGLGSLDQRSQPGLADPALDPGRD